MIWSCEELANMPLENASVVVERVNAHLNDKENNAIFDEKNFSLLWGVLGVAGVCSCNEQTCRKIWESLKKNRVLEAYQKGQLALFNENLKKRYSDNRLLKWQGLDDYEADLKFSVILEQIMAVCPSLRSEILTYYTDIFVFIDDFKNAPLNEKFKHFLEKLRPIKRNNQTLVNKTVIVSEKERILRVLLDTMAMMQRSLRDDEKSYFCFYLQEVIKNGFKANAIGLDDHILAGLMPDEKDKELAKDIMKFAALFEDTNGFFEETAIKYVRLEPAEISHVIEKCLVLAKKQDNPRGLVFALELINLGKTQDAINILDVLAHKGLVTDAIGYLHRILEVGQDVAERMLDILRININLLKEKKNYVNNEFFKEYVAKRYLQATRSFAEKQYFEESAVLLSDLMELPQLSENQQLKSSFVGIVNLLLKENESLKDYFVNLPESLNLRLFLEKGWAHVDDVTYKPTATNDEISNYSERLTDFDISHVLNNIANKEHIVCNKNSYLSDYVPFDGISDRKEEREFNNSDISINNSDLHGKLKLKNKIIQKITQVKDLGLSVPRAIHRWEDDANSTSKQDDSSSQSLVPESKRANINNILNMNPHEIDNHIKKLKNATNSVVHSAQSRAMKFKKKINNMSNNHKNGQK